MPLAIEDQIRIAAPPEAVWKLLADPFGWRFWWPQCRSAATVDHKPLRDGSRLEIVFLLGPLPITLQPTVEIAQPNRTLLWYGSKFGVTGRHAFYLEGRPEGTRVRQRQTFGGPGLLVFRLLRLDHATATMFKQNLRGLKRLTERSL